MSCLSSAFMTVRLRVKLFPWRTAALTFLWLQLWSGSSYAIVHVPSTVLSRAQRVKSKNGSISAHLLSCILLDCRESLVMSICFWCLYRITAQHPLPNQSECRKIYRYDGIYCESTYQKYVEIFVSLPSGSCISACGCQYSNNIFVLKPYFYWIDLTGGKSKSNRTKWKLKKKITSKIEEGGEVYYFEIMV